MEVGQLKTLLMQRGLIVSVFVLALAIFSFTQVIQTQAESPTLVVTATPQPPSKTVVTGEQIALFGTFQLTAVGGDIDITNITLDQTGIADDAVFSAVQVREAATGQHIGDALALRAQGKHYTRYNHTIKEGESVDFIIVANMSLALSSYNMQYPQLTLTGIDTTAEIEGDLPISGPAHRTNGSLAVGNVSMVSGPGDANTGETVQINDDTVFNSLRGTVTSAEPVVPSFVIWHMSGSAEYEDLQNIRTEIVYKGETYEFITFPYSVGSDPNKQWVGILAGAPVIDQGDSYVIRIAGSVGAGSLGKTVDFIDFLKAGVYHTGTYFGYLTVAGALYDAPAITVIGGQSVFATVHRSNAWYQNKPEISSFTINVNSGSDIEVVGFDLDFSTQITGVKIWDKSTGEVVVGPFNTLDDGRLSIVCDDWMVPVGTSTYVITADTRSSLESMMEATMKTVNSASYFKINSN
jgi:hypothetical protein